MTTTTMTPTRPQVRAGRGHLAPLLRAEWAHLNDPNRLSDLARRHLDLAPVAGVQVVRFDILPARPAPSDGAEPADPIATLLSQIGGGENQK